MNDPRLPKTDEILRRFGSPRRIAFTLALWAAIFAGAYALAKWVF